LFSARYGFPSSPLPDADTVCSFLRKPAIFWQSGKETVKEITPSPSSAFWAVQISFEHRKGCRGYGPRAIFTPLAWILASLPKIFIEKISGRPLPPGTPVASRHQAGANCTSARPTVPQSTGNSKASTPNLPGEAGRVYSITMYPRTRARRA